MWFERFFKKRTGAEPVQMDIPTLLEIPQQEVTNELYEMIQDAQRQKPACDFVSRPPKDVAFTVTLEVPIGYKIGEALNYRLEITMDTHDLKVTVEEEIKDGIAMVEDEQGNFEELKCPVRVSKVKLKGVLIYNSIVGTFEAEKSLIGSEKTYFISDNKVPVQMVLGYSGAECLTGENPLKEYAITLAKGKEFLVTTKGERIFVDEEQRYFEQLNMSGVTRSIHIPYILTIMPADDPIS